MIKVEEYRKGKFPNVADDIDPATKGKDWFIAKSEYLYWMYVNDMGYVQYSDVSKIQTLRLYAEAKQPTSKYMDRLMPLKTVNGSKVRKGSYNISWDILSVMPKFISKIMGMYSKYDFNATAHCIDEMSDEQRNMMKLRKWVEIKEREFLGAIDTIAGTGPSQEETPLPFEPQTLQELDMIDKMGGFKLWTEIAMEKALRWSYELSDWDELKKKFIKDYIVIGKAITKDYTDTFSKRAKTRYADPEFFVGIQTKYSPDHSQLTEAGEMIYVTIQDLWETGEFTKDELEKIARTYSGLLLNPALYGEERNYDQNPLKWDEYKGYKVCVLDHEFQSVDTKVSRAITTEDGEKRIYDEPFDSKVENTPNREIVRSKKKRWYRTKWIIGTKYVYDYGYQYDVPHDNEDDPRCSFNAYTVAERSMVDLCISSLDDLQMAVLKYRNAVAKGKPSGIKVEWGSLTKMTIGGKVMDPKDILVAYRENGDIVYRASVDGSGRPQQGINNPVEELKGGIGPYLPELIQCFKVSLDFIREQTGLNEIVDASTPDKDAQVGTSKIAEAATNDILKPILDAYKFLKKASARNLASRWQIIATFAEEEIKGSISALGSSTMEIIRIGAELGLPTYGIGFDATIDEHMIVRIDDMCIQSIKAGKNGQPGINLRDYVFILRMLDRGEIKLAEVYLAYREQQEKDLIDKRAAQNQQMNNEGAMMQLQMKEASEIRVIQEQGNVQMAVDTNKEREARITLIFEMDEAAKRGIEHKSSSAAVA